MVHCNVLILFNFHSVKISGFSPILCEINLEETRSSNIAVFVLRDSEFCELGKFQPSKSAKIHRNQYSEHSNML